MQILLLDELDDQKTEFIHQSKTRMNKILCDIPDALKINIKSYLVNLAILFMFLQNLVIQISF